MTRIVISPRQFSWLICSLIFTGASISVFQPVARYSVQDSWFAYWLPLLFALGVCYLYYRLSVRFPGKHIFAIVRECAGKWLGGAINLVILLYFMLVFMRSIYELSSFLELTLLRDTPFEFVMFLYILLIIYFGYKSVEVTARVNELLFPVIVVLILLLPITLSGAFSYQALKPLMVESFQRIGQSGLVATNWYSGIFIAGAFLHTIANHRHLHTAMRNGVVLSAVFLTLIQLLCVVVLGPYITARTHVPFYLLVEQIQITDFLDRLEIVAFSFMFPFFTINGFMTFIAILNGLSSFTGEPFGHRFSGAFGMFAALAPILAFRGVNELLYFANFGLMPFSLVLMPLVLIVVFLLSFRRGIKTSRPSEDAAAKPGRGPGGKKRDKDRLPRWMHAGNTVIAVSLIFLTVGMIYSKDHVWVGNVCAGGYALSLLLLVYFSHRELQEAMRQARAGG